jgi:hypothetical protein
MPFVVAIAVRNMLATVLVLNKSGIATKIWTEQKYHSVEKMLYGKRFLCVFLVKQIDLGVFESDFFLDGKTRLSSR